MLSLSVLGDSAVEHYRGSFRNPAMWAPLRAGAVSLVLNLMRVFGKGKGTKLADFTTLITGAAGLAFHTYNIAKRPGSPTLNGLFYGAPIGAPAALVLAGCLGAAAGEFSTRPVDHGVNFSNPRLVGAASAVGLLGSVGEAGLLHFRGAYHNPFMWTPIILPPVAATMLGRDIVARTPHRSTAIALFGTAAMGLVGAGFHVFGVARNMGGWRNWRQNLLAGPPIPAPPAFTGLALAGLGALLAMRRGSRA